MNRKWGLVSVLALLLLLAYIANNSVPQAEAQATGWYDDSWTHRRPVTISNPCGEDQIDFQVQVMLDSSFDFAQAEPDGSDVRITDNDGVTEIPFWIENWSPIDQTASIWVKVPLIPAAGTTIYLYYGNPNPPGPDLVNVPPLGPWQKHPDNPIIPIGDPGGGNSLLAENMVYDPETNHYWLTFANYRDGSIGLIWSDTPGDPTTWHWHGSVVSSANSPHLLRHDGTWYMFYSDRGHGGPPYPISVSTSNIVSGTYVYVGMVLTSTETWEAYRVDEPYAFQRSDGKWILLYMGDAGNTSEQVGYAQADEVLGPYTKFPGNPCLPFGAPGSIDAGTVADAWAVEFQNTYYIGYTASPTKSHPWRTTYATTTDWITFTKSNQIILDLGLAGEWDEANAFRGAVTRFGDTYYFPYTGSTAVPYVYRMGIATQPTLVPEPLNDPQQVFEFYDGFDGDMLDSSRWSVNYQGAGGTIDVGGGVLTMTGQSAATYGYVQMWGASYIGTGTLLETYARHLDAGLNAGENPSFPNETNTAGEVGYKTSDFSNVIRMMDFPDLQKYTMQAISAISTSGYVDMAVDWDAEWHTYRIYRTVTATAEYQVDDNAAEILGPPAVPTSTLPPWLMSYARPPAPQSRFEVDWIRVRQRCATELAGVLGPEQELGIAIAKTPDVQKVPSGSDVVFGIAVTNTGDVDLSNVHIEDVLVPDCARTFAGLAAKASVTYTCSVPNVTSDLTNTATVTGTVSASAYVTDTDTAFVDILPTIEVDKTAEPTEVRQPGGTITFTVRVTNTSAELFTITSLTDSIHGNLNGQGICSVPQALGVDAVYRCTFTATVSGSAGYTEIDEVTAAGHDDDGNPVQASDTATVTISSLPSIVVTPTALTVSEPTGSASFTFTLTTQPAASVTVPLTTSNDECSAAPSFITLDGSSWTSGVSATVTAVDDDIVDGSQTCLVQTGLSSSNDPNYQDLDPADVAVTVLDEDETDILVAPTTLTIGEPDGSDTFLVTLRSQPTAPVTVPLSTSNGECSVVPSSLALDGNSWTGGVTATVTAVDDDVADGSQTCLVQTGLSSSSDPDYQDVDPADVAVTVLDDDQGGILVAPTTLTIGEPDGSDTFFVTLRSQPTAPVTVPLTTSNGECSVAPSSLTLDGSSWAGGVSATVTAVDDDIVDGSQTCLVQTGLSSSSDPHYDGLDPEDVIVTVQDNDVRIYMPLIIHNWPPVPPAPILHPISNSTGIGTYTVSWSAVSQAQAYILEEATNVAFASAKEIYVGPSISYEVTGRGAARYYYRVKARGTWADGNWSNVQQVDVLWEAEPNDDGQSQANGPIVCGQTYSGAFPNWADVNDYFYFDLSAACSIELWLTTIPAENNYDLVLRDDNLTLLGYSGQLGNANEHIKMGIMPVARYKIQVYHRGGDGSTQPYHLQLACQCGQP